MLYPFLELKKENGQAGIPIAFIDEDHKKQGIEIHGIRVVGNYNNLNLIVKKYNIDLIIIALPEVSSEKMSVLVNKAEETLVEATFLNESYEEARKLGAPLIHWLPANSGIQCEVMRSDVSVAKGVAEEACRGLNPDEIIQFERFGFVRVDEVNEKLIVYFAHR